MAQNAYDVEVNDSLVGSDDDYVEARYIYKGVQGDGGACKHQVKVKRSDYTKFGATIKKGILPFEKFVIVFRAFLLANKAGHSHVEKAWSCFDRDAQDKIDIHQLAAYMPIIVPNGTPSMLVDNLRKLEKKLGWRVEEKVDSTKFTRYIGDECLGRDTVLECLQKN